MLLAVLRQPSDSQDMVARPVRAAATDLLTGLPTRQFFEERLAAAASAATPGTRKLAVLFIDLDGFKPVNDTFGHAAATACCEQVGERLQALSRAATTWSRASAATSSCC